MRIALALALTTIVGLVGQRAAGNYTVYGPGTVSCGRWTTARSDVPSNWEAHSAHISWVLGFLSGAGYEGKAFPETDSAAIEGWLDLYCKQHPLDHLSVASAHLLDELASR